MPEPGRDPNLAAIKRTALYALVAGVVIALLKFGLFHLTGSVAVLSDALESLINVTAAGAMLYTIHYSNRPADREHPYGHGKIEFMAVGLEGWLILIAALVIGVEAIRRLFNPPELHLDTGIWLLAGVGVLDAILAAYVWRAGRRYQNAVLQADGRHLITDVASTAGVVVGLVLVQGTGWDRLDPIVAIIMATLILAASWRLLWQSFHGLMDHADPEDDRAISDILNDEVQAGQIHGYHKVRHRHTGPFHWVDMHLQVDGDMTVTAGHALASRIEGRIEQRLGRANATAHLEPYDPQRHPPAGPSAADFGRTPASPTTAPPDAPPAEPPPPPDTPPDAPRSSPPPSAPADRPELADLRDPDDDPSPPTTPNRPT